MAVEITTPSETPTTTRMAGVGRLRVSRSGSCTVLERGYATSPLKIFTTRGIGPTCWMSCATLGGGFVGGDVVDLSVELASGTRAVLTTQASTKVYRSARPSHQWLSASIGDEALLALLPDPMVCFRDADFTQQQRFDLTASANLVLLDWLTSGRHAVGERWAFRRYESRIDVHRAGRRILHDAIALNVRDGSIAERMSSCDVLLTAIMTGPMFSTEAGPAIERVNREFANDPNLICAAWPLGSEGAFIRVAGRQLEQVAAMVRETFAFLSNVLGSGPWTRKW